MTPKLSIIVPIYNVEQYLRKCVDSLLAQDYNDYEIILVDDGSTDGSGAMCDEIVRANGENGENGEMVNIRVIHQENGGLSAARNAGLKEAKGDYVCFVDSDDYWEENVLGSLMMQIKQENLDVLRFNYQNVNEKYEAFQPFKNIKPYFDYSDVVEDGETFLNKRLGYACYAVMFVIRRDLIISNDQSPMTNDKCEKDNILFTPGIYFEDTDWTPRMLLKAKRVSSTEKIVYNYLWREGSITLPTDPVKKKKIFEDRVKLLHGFIERQKEVQDKSWFEWNIASVTVSLLSAISSFPSKGRRTYIREFKSLNIFPLTTYRAVGNNLWRIRLANLSPTLYCGIFRIILK